MLFLRNLDLVYGVYFELVPHRDPLCAASHIVRIQRSPGNRVNTGKKPPRVISTAFRGCADGIQPRLHPSTAAQCYYLQRRFNRAQKHGRDLPRERSNYQ